MERQEVSSYTCPLNWWFVILCIFRLIVNATPPKCPKNTAIEQEVLSVIVSEQWKGTASTGTSKEHHLCLMDTRSSENGLFAGDFFCRAV